MYRHDVLEEFREEIKLMMGEAILLPPVPPKGSLDLDLVLESPFFFA
jgi:DNA-directed RNA polymerase